MDRRSTTHRDGARSRSGDDRSARRPESTRTFGANPYLSLTVRADSAMLDLAPGARLDRFVVKQLLGRGGASAVYLAEDTVRSDDVAVKLTPVGPSDPGVSAEQLQREREVYDRIQDHRHVLKVHDVHLVRHGAMRLLVLSMEHADGGAFRQWLAANDWQTRRTEGLTHFKQICLGVAAIHECGLIHGDVKPENFLFVDGVLKAADFGFSACVQRLTRRLDSTDEDRRAEFEAGTPAYMSPEQFVAPYREDLDARADIYSLAAVLYEILHPQCRPPFGGTYARLRDLHLHAPPPALPEASEAVAHVVARCLQKDPDDRCQSVHELLDCLEGRHVSAINVAADADLGSDVADQIAAAWRQACDLFEDRRLGPAADVCRRIVQACPDHADAHWNNELGCH